MTMTAQNEKNLIGVGSVHEIYKLSCDCVSAEKRQLPCT